MSTHEIETRRRTSHRVSAGFRGLWANTDGITKWVQVLALIIAAIWTFKNFTVAEKPSLEPNAEVDAALKDKARWDADTCRVEYAITVKNIGRVSFDVDRVTFRAWETDIPKAIPGKAATFVDAESFRSGTQIVDETPHANLVRHYPPGSALTQSFTWLLRNQQPGITDFEVEVHAKNGKMEVVSPGRMWGKSPCS